MIFGLDTAAARRYAELVNRLFAIESGEAPFPPGFLLEVERPDWSFLKREILWTSGEMTVAANVGNLSRAQIHNPAASAANPGRIVVVEGFVVANPTVAASYQVTRDGALAGAPTANLALDTRVPLPAGGDRKAASVNRIDNSLPAVSGTRIDRRTSQVGVDVIFNFRTGPMHPITLAPNTVCEVICLAVNTLLIAYAFGYERPATPDELAA